jgi:hypothetical protein
MRDELVINARQLRGEGPLWMLYEALRRQNVVAVRLIVSDAQTAHQVVQALQEAGVNARLDQIGEEYHILGKDLLEFRASSVVTRKAGFGGPKREGERCPKDAG